MLYLRVAAHRPRSHLYLRDVLSAELAGVTLSLSRWVLAGGAAALLSGGAGWPAVAGKILQALLLGGAEHQNYKSYQGYEDS